MIPAQTCAHSRGNGKHRRSRLRKKDETGTFMHYLLLAVLCSVLVSVLLKRAERLRIDVAQAMTWNYAAAAALCALLLKPSLAPLREPGAPWFALLALAVALPAVFLAFGRAVALAGIVRSDAAQRLSLLPSLAAAFALFGETANRWKLAGLCVGFFALAGILARPAGEGAAPWRRAWPWLVATCAGYAGIDVLLKRVALSGTASTTALQASFSLAFALMLAWQAVRAARGGTRFAARSLCGGLLLGALNFANIYFYVRAHQALPRSPATVFATMNIGVVALGTLVGAAFFGEKTGTWNRVGLLLAFAAIALVAAGAR
jgi:drug/metabolite transporter (DMT)-like permease